MKGLARTAICLLLAVAVLSIAAGAQVAFDTTLSHPITGSVLVFPFVEGPINLVSIVNTSTNRTVLQNNQMAGTIRVHFQYVDGGHCTLSNRVEVLTPGDITTFATSSHAPGFSRGWLYVVAEDYDTGRPIDFDYLMGDALWVDSSLNLCQDVPAIAFRSGAEELNAPVGRSTGNMWAFTDIDSDGKLDFNDSEYERMPKTHYLATFLEQASHVADELVVLSPLGGDFEVVVDALVFNNDEEMFSATVRFTCWDQIKLTDVSRITLNLDGNPAKRFESGWLRLVPRHAINTVTGQYVTQDNVAILPMIRRTYYGSLGLGGLFAGDGEVNAVELDG